METREDLLRNLQFVRSKIKAIISLEKQKANLDYDDYRPEMSMTPKIGIELKEKLLIVVFIFLAVGMMRSLVTLVPLMIGRGRLMNLLLCAAMATLLCTVFRWPQFGVKKLLKIAAVVILFYNLIDSGEDGGNLALYLVFVIGVYRLRGPQSGFKKFCKGLLFVAIIGLMFYTVTWMLKNILNGILLWPLLEIVLIVVVSAAAIVYIKKANARAEIDNARTEIYNAEAREINAAAKARYDAKLAELNLRQQAEKEELLYNSSSWYPPDYYSLDVVEYFIDQIKNFRADSIKEALHNMDEENYRQQMLASQRALEDSAARQEFNQQAMNDQMRMANALSIMGMFQQGQILNAIHNNTSAVNQTNNILNGFHNYW